MMTVHKLTVGDGYTYLTRHIVGGDQDRASGRTPPTTTPATATRPAGGPGAAPTSSAWTGRWWRRRCATCCPPARWMRM
jgi:hypothetical protein